MIRQFQISFFVGLVLIDCLALAAQPPCEEIRAGIDIGSGTTKMVVARVDSCTQTIQAILSPQPGALLERAVEYKKYIVETVNGPRVFRPQIEKAGLAALADLKEIALAHGAQKFAAVATSAFRNVSASYAADLISLIETRLNIPVRVIEQSEEARLGFLATTVKLDISPAEVLVWDIGGGSMQLSFWDEASRQVAGYQGEFANNSMEAFVVEQLQGMPASADTSPNPMLSPTEKDDPNNHVYAAIRKAEQVARTTVTAEQRAHFRTIPLVIGIGGVHYYSNCEVTKQSPGCAITREALQRDILDHAHLTDAELVAAGRASSVNYASKRITAGTLTIGFMNALGFERVRSMKVDMADGILIRPDYW